jgi:putative sugar O-methyltransferase
MSTAHPYWEKQLTEIRQLIQSDEMSNFLNWGPILNTMFPLDNTIKEKYNYLKGNKNWKHYKKYLTDVDFGNPQKSIELDNVTGNTIQQVYQISILEEITECAIKDAESILEIGGGYGNMCRIIKNMEHKRNYYIYDFPEVCEIQQSFLESAGTKLPYFFITDPEKLEKEYDLIIGMFSLAEMPLLLRKVFAKINCNVWYIAHGAHFEHDINNMIYFKLFKDKKPEFTWHDLVLDIDPRQHYLIGINNATMQDK